MRMVSRWGSSDPPDFRGWRESSTGIYSRFATRCLTSTDFATEFLHVSLVRLALTGGGIVARALVKETQESDGIHRAEVICKNGDSLAVEVDGVGVIRGGAHRISGGGEMDGIHDGDGQLIEMTGCDA